MFYSPPLLDLLVRDRQRTVAREIASARRFRLRRSLAGAFFAVARAVAWFGTVLDEEPAPENAIA